MTERRNNARPDPTADRPSPGPGGLLLAGMVATFGATLDEVRCEAVAERGGRLARGVVLLVLLLGVLHRLLRD